MFSAKQLYEIGPRCVTSSPRMDLSGPQLYYTTHGGRNALHPGPDASGSGTGLG